MAESLNKQIKRVVKRFARVSPKLKRYADNGLSRRIVKLMEQEVAEAGLTERIIDRRFKYEAEHGHEGKKWKPLTRKYLLWKQKHGLLLPRNQRTGFMWTEARDAVHGTWRVGVPIKWDIGMLHKVDYAEHPQRERPFFKSPSVRYGEMKEINRKAVQVLEKEMRRMGRS